MRKSSLVFLVFLGCSGASKGTDPLGPPINPDCTVVSGPPPSRPEVTFLDSTDGGICLSRFDSVDFILYVSELEAWVKTTYVGCGNDYD